MVYRWRNPIASAQAGESWHPWGHLVKRDCYVNPFSLTSAQRHACGANVIGSEKFRKRFRARNKKIILGRNGKHSEKSRPKGRLFLALTSVAGLALRACSAPS